MVWFLKFVVLATSKVILGYESRLMTVHTHSNFIALSDWEIRPVIWPDITLSHIILILRLPGFCPILFIHASVPGYEATSINLISHWLDSTGNQTSDLLHTRLALYRFGHRALSYTLVVWSLTQSKLDGWQPCPVSVEYRGGSGGWLINLCPVASKRHPYSQWKSNNINSICLFNHIHIKG